MAHIRTYDLPGVWVHSHTDMIHSVFKADHSSSVFAPVETREQRMAMAEFGYSNPMTFAHDHELAHHFVAMERGLPHSAIVWADAHKDWSSFDGAEWPNRTQDEEHLVNSFLRFYWECRRDSHGCLDAIFGTKLDDMAERFKGLASKSRTI